jgi:hypothetical protein
MDLFESNTHSFIVKIWLEDNDPVTWRGHITHVQSGRRCHFENLSTLVDFVTPYLEQMGATFGRLQRMKLWFKRWRSHSKHL